MSRLPMRRNSRERERGATIVESALCLPVFLLVIFATMEFGLAFRSYLTLSATTREAGRFSATLGNDVDSDFQVVTGIVASLAGTRGATLEQVVIYKSTGPLQTTAGGALAACRAGSVANLCNSYVGSALTTPANNWACNYTSPDRYWCPGVRKVNLSDPPDYIGVYIKVRHQGLTGILGMTRTFTDEIVMRLEPHRT